MLTEIAARRRRLRASLGDRGQGLIEFLVLAGLVLGSLGLFARAGMAEAAPWGFALPFVFVGGYIALDWRRQNAVDAAATPARYDWAAFLWAMACALLSVAAFVVAWGAQIVPPPPEVIWTPPDGAVDSTIVPTD